MPEKELLPLFVLPMVLLPGEIQQLRVFEPRYRQMLDDCLLEEKKFGLVLNDPETLHNGWDGPSKYGCEAEIIQHETIGSNHFIEILGKRRFLVQDIIDPALPPFSDDSMSDLIPQEGIFPDLQSIMERIPEESNYHKLYLAAEVEYIEDNVEISEIEEDDLKQLISSLLMNIGTEVIEVEAEVIEQWVSDRVSIMFSKDSNILYTIISMIVHDLETKHHLLGKTSNQEIIDEVIEIMQNMVQ
jgi:Lon protease-like protein